MLPLYAVHLRDLGPGDRVQISCLVCEHTGLLTADFLLPLGLDRHDKVLDLQRRMRCRGCGVRDRALVSVRWTAA